MDEVKGRQVLGKNKDEKACRSSLCWISTRERFILDMSFAGKGIGSRDYFRHPRVLQLDRFVHQVVVS
jgi:hypothetical protein